jgi:hypothetical protein
LLFGSGPPLIALRQEALIDYRTEPPTIIPWQDIEDLDVVFHSENDLADKKSVIMRLAGGVRYELNLLGLNIGVWKMKRLIRERWLEARREALAAAAAGAVSIAETPRHGAEARPLGVGLGVLIGTFPSRPALLLVLLKLPLFVAPVVILIECLAGRFSVLLVCAVAVTVGCVVLLCFCPRWGRDRIQVYSHGVVFRGLFRSRTYFFADILGAVVFSVNSFPEAAILKLSNGKSVHLPTATERVRELCDLINDRV